MSRITRRGFMATTAAAAASAAFGAPAVSRRRKPNLLLIITDQQHIETISAAGCPHVQTPWLDRLCRRGVRFDLSYSPNPLCSPARSAFLTGRTASEAGVWHNGLPIRPSVPHIGQWLAAKAGYEAIYAGKWHLPASFTTRIPGFTVLAPGVGGQGNLGDTSVSRACEAFLRNRSGNRPFLLVASFLQPHDICQWLRLNQDDPGRLPFTELSNELPPLPPNFRYDRREPQVVARRRESNEPGSNKGRWSELHWRYYRWAYYRLVEMVETEAGRILQTLEGTGLDKETLVVFISDHGEGLAHHQMVRKNNLYDEAARVPLIVSWPGHVGENVADERHLVSPLDIMATFCDYAGVEPPEGLRGRSLRPLAEGRKPADWREHLAVEDEIGRMVLTTRYKYMLHDRGSSREQLLDLELDPGETRNFAGEASHAEALASLRRFYRQWFG